MALGGCRLTRDSITSRFGDVEPFNFDISAGDRQFHIEGYLARGSAAGRIPGLLVLNGETATIRQCVEEAERVCAMGIRVACVSIPGYGNSSGPGRYVGASSVDAARVALDAMARRADIDATRLAVWGVGDGAVAAGLLMDSDPRPRALILESGAYDMVGLWPAASLATKLSILREVWPSRRILRERSVIANMPHRLDVSVLILHGQRDHRIPVMQAQELEGALRSRGARVTARYFPRGPHDLGRRVDTDLRAFLRDHLIASASGLPS